ncbi:MAG: hypothetical protein ACOYO0_01795 [Sandarakinorhabdus sp.]
MESSNVVDAADRFKKQSSTKTGLAAASHRGAIDRLRATVRTTELDRSMLAKRMTDWSVQLDSNSPKRAAHLMMAKAWSDDHSKKTSRFFDFGSGEASKTRESSGSSWAKLIETAASLLHPVKDSDGGMAIREQERAINRLLLGTSFRPANPAMSAPAGVYDLLVRISEKMAHRIGTSTRLFELWEVLERSPFDVTWLRSSQADFSGPLSTAAKFADDLGRRLNVDGEYRFRFTTDTNDCDWSRPSLLIGALARRHDVEVFVLPEEFRGLYDHSAIPDSKNHWELAEKFQQWAMKTSGNPYILPDTSLRTGQGFGWVREKRDLVNLVWLKMDHKDGMEIIVSGDYYNHIQAPVFTDQRFLPDALRMIEHRVSDLGVYPDFDYLNESYSTHVIPNSLRGLVPNEYAQHGYVRLMTAYPECTGESPFHDTGWGKIGDVGDQDWLKTVLFGGHEAEFIPLFTVPEDAPMPAPARSLAAALLANVEAPHEEQLINRLETEATRIAEAGLKYYNAMLTHWSDAIELL